eukprot:755039-Hanusia_phi.AAC.1
MDRPSSPTTMTMIATNKPTNYNLFVWEQMRTEKVMQLSPEKRMGYIARKWARTDEEDKYDIDWYNNTFEMMLSEKEALQKQKEAQKEAKIKERETKMEARIRIREAKKEMPKLPTAYNLFVWKQMKTDEVRQLM